MRQLPKDFMSDLQNGILKDLLQEVIEDKEMDLPVDSLCGGNRAEEVEKRG